MTELRSLQRQALSAFLDDENEIFLEPIAPERMPPGVRIEIYRNNLRENYRKCLANAYPVIERLVGEDCFRGLASRYCRQHPSTNSDLQFFGTNFPSLLAELYGDSEFAYLPDVAQLELAIEDALIAPRSEAIEIERLSQVNASDYPLIRFVLRPGLSLIRSRFPVLSIWQTNQTDDGNIVDLSADGEQLAVLREDKSAEIRHLDAAAYALAEYLAAGSTLGEASEQIIRKRGFDLSASLNSLFLNRCLGDFVIATGEPRDS